MPDNPASNENDRNLREKSTQEWLAAFRLLCSWKSDSLRKIVNTSPGVTSIQRMAAKHFYRSEKDHIAEGFGAARRIVRPLLNICPFIKTYIDRRDQGRPGL